MNKTQTNITTAPDNDRTDQRHTLTMRAAKLVSESRDFLCIIRDVSESGVRLRFFHPMPAGRALSLQLPCGTQYPLTAVWARGMDAGYSFQENIDIDALIREVGTKPYRPLRFSVDIAASLMVQGEQIPARLLDLSLQGAGLACDYHMAINQPIMLETDYTSIMAARVRWRLEGRYGLVLDDTFGLTELATLIAHHHDAERPPPVRSLPGFAYDEVDASKTAPKPGVLTQSLRRDSSPKQRSP